MRTLFLSSLAVVFVWGCTSAPGGKMGAANGSSPSSTSSESSSNTTDSGAAQGNPVQRNNEPGRPKPATSNGASGSIPAPTRTIPTPTSNEIPAKDITVEGKYTLNNTTISVAGVCSFDGKKITCWNQDKTPNPALEKMVEEGMKKDAHVQLVDSVDKKKHRIIVTKTSRSSASESNENVYVNSVGSPDTGNAMIYMPNPKSQADPNRSDFYEARVLDAKPEDKSTSLWLKAVKMERSVDFPLAVGQNTKIFGASITISALRPATSQEIKKFSQGDDIKKGWLMELKIDSPNGNKYVLGPNLVNKNGEVIANLDANFTPMTAQQVSEAARQNEPGKPSKVKFYPTIFTNMENSKAPKSQQFLVLFDPAKAAKLSIFANLLRNIQIPNIPLDK